MRASRRPADRLIELVPNVSEGRRLDVVDRLAAAITAGPGCPPPRPDERREPQPLGVHARRRARTGQRRPRAARRGGDPTRSTWTRTRASTRGSARSTSSRSCPWPHDDGRRRSSSPGRSAPGSPTRFALPVYLYAAAATRPERVKLADVRRGQYEGLKTEIGFNGREPDFGPARIHPSAGAVAVGARPFLIAYNINLASTTSSSPGGSPAGSASRAAVCPRSRPTASGSRSSARAQVSMNLLDFSVTPLWLVWDTVRDVAAEDGVELAESELIGLAPLASFLAVADHAEAPPETRSRRRARGGRGLPAAARLLARCRSWNSAWRPRRRVGPAGDRQPVLRVIEGGRNDDPTPGLLVVGASEIVTMAGGVRMGPDQAEVGRASRPTPVDPARRRPRSWPSGRAGSLAVGPRDAVEVALEAEGYDLGRFARLDAGGGAVTPGLVDPHTHLCSPARRENELKLRQRGAGYLEILAAVAASSRPSRRPGPPRRTSCWPTAGAGSTRCWATGSRRSRPSPATAWTSRPSCGSWTSPTGWGARARSRSSRRCSAPTPSRPSSAAGPDGDGGLRPLSHR